MRWVTTMAQAMKHGGKKMAAGMLGLSPSGFSKLIANPERGFDEKTLRAISWMETSKAHRYPLDKFPRVGEPVTIGPMTVEARQEGEKEIFYVWRLTK